MKKQNKNVKKNRLFAKIGEWAEAPESKYDKKLPEGVIAVRTLDYDLIISILVVSLLINLTLFASWMVIQADPTIELLLVALK